LRLRTGALSSPKKQCHDPPLFGKILGCQREREKKRTGRKRRENKREGRMQRCSDGRPPRVHERQRRPRHETLPNSPFHTGNGGRPGGLWDAIVKFTLHYKSRSSLKPNRAILLV
jgi:transposase